MINIINKTFPLNVRWLWIVHSVVIKWMWFCLEKQLREWVGIPAQSNNLFIEWVSHLTLFSKAVQGGIFDD